MKPLSQIVLNPSQQANAGPLRYYQVHAVSLRTRPDLRSGYEIDEYQLHAHPDAVEYFEELAQGPLASCLGAAYGYPVLVNPANTILFATVSGTGYTLVRLPEAERKAVLTSFSGKVKPAQGESHFQDFGEEWMVFDLFGVAREAIRAWFMSAYAYTDTKSV
ncbi:MAG TPA: hypothetical protein VFV38_10245 [Ktedonobacteraceae bacterium]|nr:hypothetical protein [Ktedonobacteraceae bacterium]